jgi:hypothetical protein
VCILGRKERPGRKGKERNEDHDERHRERHLFMPGIVRV